MTTTATSSPTTHVPVLPSIGQVDGAKVRGLREQRKLTQEQFSDLVGISLEELRAVESDALQPLTQTIVGIAKQLNVPTRAILEDPPTAVAEVAEATGTAQPTSMRREADIEDDDTPGLIRREPQPINRELIDGIKPEEAEPEAGPEPVVAEETPVETPEQVDGWDQTSDVEQRQRLYAAREAAEILREFTGDNPFSRGGSKSINPVDVITLAQWIVYGTHDQ